MLLLMILIVPFCTQHCEYKPFGWNIGNVGEFFYCRGRQFT